MMKMMYNQLLVLYVKLIRDDDRRHGHEDRDDDVYHDDDDVQLNI